MDDVNFYLSRDVHCNAVLDGHFTIISQCTRPLSLARPVGSWPVTFLAGSMTNDDLGHAHDSAQTKNSLHKKILAFATVCNAAAHGDQSQKFCSETPKNSRKFMKTFLDFSRLF